MKSSVKSVEMFTPVALMNIPKGKYKGVWGGYQVSVIINGTQYRLEVENSIRGINVPCTVLVREDSVEVISR